MRRRRRGSARRRRRRWRASPAGRASRTERRVEHGMRVGSRPLAASAHTPRSLRTGTRLGRSSSMLTATLTVPTTLPPCFITAGFAATASGFGSNPSTRPKEKRALTSACSKMCLKRRPPTVSAGRVLTTSHVSLTTLISGSPKPISLYRRGAGCGRCASLGVCATAQHGSGDARATHFHLRETHITIGADMSWRPLGWKK